MANTRAVPVRDIPGIDPRRVPRHIAFIMDGNGRWAQQRDLKRTEGHTAGEHALFEAVEGCLEMGVPWCTVYAFSTENWKRPKDEVKFLIDFNREVLYRRRDELNDKGVRINFIGQRNWRVPRKLIREMDESIELTKNNRDCTFTIAFNYGGRAELTDAVAAIVRSGISADKVTEKVIARHLYNPEMPDPDLMIRSSGETRLSNFLIWQLAYAEYVFDDVLWPDVTREHLFEWVRQFQQRNRRFGGL